MSQEALLRLEYKLDLVIAALQAQGWMLPTEHLPPMREMGSLNDNCPCCGVPIRVTADFLTESLTRTCGCVSPVRIVPGISGLLPVPERSTHARQQPDADRPVPSDAPPQGGGGR